MSSIKINAEHKYRVELDCDRNDALAEIVSEHKKVLIILTTDISRMYPNITRHSNFETLRIPNGEAAKNIATVQLIWKRAAQLKLERNDAIVAIGGGATTDVAGFAASTWLRGISWYAIPTSLAGMVDAAIGGKTGINQSFGKNLVGSFYSPQKVFIDLSFIDSLSTRDYNAGLAEVIKCGFIKRPEILTRVVENRSNIARLIELAVRTKAEVVGKDFKESRAREILNYGHTLGHAIEKDSNFRLRHGEAISIGMVFAAQLSNQLLNLTNSEVQIHKDLLSKLDLPITYPKKRWPALQKLLFQDKKVRNGQLRFIGLSRIGKPAWLEEVNQLELKRCYETIAS
jgi:3-dehydroquinate synthase